MVLTVALNSAWKKMRLSRVVLLSGLLTFLFLVEFCIGLRNLHYIFSLWQASTRIPSHNPTVSWTLCMSTVLVCVISSVSVSLISAMWEQKQLTVNGKEKSPIRFALHIFVSGMVWRYVSLWFADNKKLQKKEALLLTLVKFFFTQFFTIPMVIVHASSSEKLEEVIYDLCSVSCISINLILTCIMFTWCKAEVNELKKWNYETIDLIPLIFCQSSDDPEQPSTDQSNSDAKGKEVSNNNPSLCCDLTDDNLESTLVRIIVLFQTFSFTFGRLLALGILLKLAGIYALTILFLQLLISVVYLKFQVPFLVSDSLPKWRQLTRLAFMSYILIFEWHLNRDPKTGYDFTSNIKHSMLYYFIATMESVFYFITWAITEIYASSSSFNGNIQKLKFSRNIIIMGILSLMFSLIVHFLLLFWHSRRLSAFINSVQRSYLSSKIRIVNGVRNNNKSKSKALEANKSKPEMSDPIPTCNSADGCPVKIESHSPLEKRSSYKDLREPIDEEIEIYARKNKNVNSCTTTEDKKIEGMPGIQNECYIKSGATTSCTKENRMKNRSKDIKKTSMELDVEKNVNNSACMEENSYITDISMNDSTLKRTKSGDNLGEKATGIAISAPRTKMVQISSSINEGWSKFSSMSKKFTGTMRDQIQKRKEQIQNFRNPSSEKSSDVHQQNTEVCCSIEETPKVDSVSVTGERNEDDSSESSLAAEIESSEAYFLGDPRIYEEGNYDSGEDVIDSGNGNDSSDNNSEVDGKKEVTFRSASMTDVNEDASQPEHPHIEGSDLCPCYLCRPEGRMLHRRSSSVPTGDGKLRQHFLSSMMSDEIPKESSMVRCPSSPNIIRVDVESRMTSDSQEETSDTDFLPSINLTGRAQKLSVFASDNRVEHYV